MHTYNTRTRLDSSNGKRMALGVKVKTPKGELAEVRKVYASGAVLVKHIDSYFCDLWLANQLEVI